MLKNKICFVVQRYGLEVNGGAELHCRQLAEKMLSKCSDITVLTSKAIDYMTWKNEYSSDEENINGIKVLRFGVEHPRVQKVFDEINGRFFDGEIFDSKTELEWLEKQGPYCPTLIEYIHEHKNDFDVFIFFTYLYYPTVMGIPEVAEKAVVIPTAHDNEPFFRMKIFDNVFLKPKAFFFNTTEERDFIQQKYNNKHISCSIGGVGVDIPADVNAERFKEKYSLSSYLVFVGRVDISKGCGVLFDYFSEYKKRNPEKSDLKLVLMGKEVMQVPKRDDIVSLGFVSDQDKFDGIAGAEVLVLPSEFESLSMVVLEAMSVRTNVMVNGKCSVLRGHCTKSNGAFFYNNYFEFEGQLNWLLCAKHSAERAQMKENAWAYVQENYQWDAICDRLQGLIEKI